MARFFRRDVQGDLGKPVELSNGWVRVDGFISRTGIQVYDRGGKEFREYRPPAEVFRGDTLESFVSVPLTNDHPAGGALTSHNTKAYQVGTVESPKQDGDRTRARMLITDAKTIESLKSGKTQLSCGYTCDLDETPGTTPEGERYDAVQRNILGNHVAIVDEARGGPELRVRMDSAGVLLDPPLDAAVRVDVTSTPNSTTQKASEDQKTMEELKKALEVAAQEKARADAADQKIAALTVDLEKSKARADILAAEVKDLPAKITAQVAARAALESVARDFLGESTSFAGKADAEIKRAVIASAGSVKVDGKSEAYVDAAFDLVCESEPRTDGVGKVEDVRTDADEADPVSKAQEAFARRMTDQFKPRSA